MKARNSLREGRQE